MNKFYVLIYIILALPISCVTLSTNQTASYQEDLSSYRPAVPTGDSSSISIEEEKNSWVEPTEDITDTINMVLDTVASVRRSTIKYVNGFTIQVYGGDSRNEATDMRLGVLRHFPDLNPKLTFDQPNYRVRIGHFYTQLEAYELYTRVKRVFKKSILVPTRIRMK